jgi:photosystem II stability/assembly factor-like uncharacterized protein
VKAFGDHSFGSAGTFNVKSDFYNGLAVTNDGGATWAYYDIGLEYPEYTARYAAFPTDDTWYVSTGSWWTDPSSKDKFALTNRVSIDKQSNKYTWEKPLKSGEMGAIAKTIDGGKTFKKVHTTPGFYFNQIDCADTETCIAVMESSEASQAVMTTDGGKTWKTVVDDGDSAMMCVQMISATEAWVGGGRGLGPEREGHYFHTVDGGATWEQTELDGGICMDISFAEGSSVGYSTVSTMIGYSMATFS